VQPFAKEQFKGRADDAAREGSEASSSYDNLGAGIGHVIGFTEGAEATAPFDNPTPVDAFNAAIVDEIFYTPPT